MRNQAAAPVFYMRSEARRRQGRGRARDHDFRRRQLVELREQRLLGFEILRRVLLNVIRTPDRLCEIGERADARLNRLRRFVEQPELA
jgi:hypothetical protein